VLDRDEPHTTEEQREGRWYAYRLAPVRVADKIVGVAGLGRDLTDLRSQEARGGSDVLGKMADLADDMVFELEPAGTVTFVNSAAEGVCGRRSSEVVGRPFEDLVDPDARDGWREMFQRVIATGQSVGREEVPVRRPDGTVFYGELNLTASVEPSTGEVTGARGMFATFPPANALRGRWECSGATCRSPEAALAGPRALLPTNRAHYAFPGLDKEGLTEQVPPRVVAFLACDGSELHFLPCTTERQS
jgi:PAS domain S-box-containing protein